MKKTKFLSLLLAGVLLSALTTVFATTASSVAQSESFCPSGAEPVLKYSDFENRDPNMSLAEEGKGKIDAHFCQSGGKEVIYISSLDPANPATLNKENFDIYVKQNFGLFYPDQATLNAPGNEALKAQFAGYPVSVWEAPKSQIEKVVLNNVKLPADSSYLFFGFRAPIEIGEAVDSSAVTNMEGMFAYARHFNAILPATFTTNNVTNMSAMFKGAKTFNQPLTFDTSNVTNMSYMFDGAEVFDQSLNFNTSSVTNMSAMFADAKSFNSSFGSDFDTSNVTDMSYMFAGADKFNQNLNFNTEKVANMDGMFLSALAFDQPLNFNFKALASAVGFLSNKYIPSNAEYLKKLLPLFVQALGADAENQEVINGLATWLEGDGDESTLPDAIKNSPFATFYKRTLLSLREKMKQGDIGVPYSIANYDALLNTLNQTLANKAVVMHVQSNFCEAEDAHNSLTNIHDNGIWCLKIKGGEVSHKEGKVKNGDVMFKEFAKFDTADNRLEPGSSGKLQKPLIKSGNDKGIFDIIEVNGDWQIVIKDASKFKHVDEKYTLVVEIVDPTDPNNKKEAEFVIIPKKRSSSVIVSGGSSSSSTVITTTGTVTTGAVSTGTLTTGNVATGVVLPEVKQNEVLLPDADVFNPTIENGKCYTRRDLRSILDSETISTSDEFKKALKFLSSYEMTMFDSVDGYDPYRKLTREEAAKIFSNFAINVLCRKPDLNLHTNYVDVANANPTLKPYIELAYQLGIMKGHGHGDGKFRPFDYISKAEVNAVLIRMILKSYLEENTGIWYQNYNDVSSALKIITKGAGLDSLSRNDLALMLFRAYKNQLFTWQDIVYPSYVLENRASFVK